MLRKLGHVKFTAGFFDTVSSVYYWGFVVGEVGLLVLVVVGGEDFDGAVGELNADEPEGARGFTDTVLAAATARAATWVELNDALGES